MLAVRGVIDEYTEASAKVEQLAKLRFYIEGVCDSASSPSDFENNSRFLSRVFEDAESLSTQLSSM